MRRLVARAGAVLGAVVTSGCGLTGSPPSEPSARAGQITLDGQTRETRSVECSQIEWSLMIDAGAEPGRAHAYLRLGGQQPVVETVSIDDIGPVNGVAGDDLGKAEATLDDTTYTITGTVVGPDPANPGRSQTMPFEIKAPC